MHIAQHDMRVASKNDQWRQLTNQSYYILNNEHTNYIFTASKLKLYWKNCSSKCYCLFNNNNFEKLRVMVTQGISNVSPCYAYYWQADPRHLVKLNTFQWENPLLFLLGTKTADNYSIRKHISARAMLKHSLISIHGMKQFQNFALNWSSFFIISQKYMCFSNGALKCRPNTHTHTHTHILSLSLSLTKSFCMG